MININQLIIVKECVWGGGGGGGAETERQRQADRPLCEVTPSPTDVRNFLQKTAKQVNGHGVCSGLDVITLSGAKKADRKCQEYKSVIDR